MADKTIAPADDLEGTQGHLPEGSSSQTTPPNDITGPADDDEAEVTSSLHGSL
jgi:hypothetical protein